MLFVVLLFLCFASVASMQTAIMTFTINFRQQSMWLSPQLPLGAALVFAAICWGCFHWLHAKSLGARGTNSRHAVQRLKRLMLLSAPILIGSIWMPVSMLLILCCVSQWMAIRYWIEAVRRKFTQLALIKLVPRAAVITYGVECFGLMVFSEFADIQLIYLILPLIVMLAVHFWCCIGSINCITRSQD